MNLFLEKLAERQCGLVRSSAKVWITSHFRDLEPREYIIVDSLKLAYLNVPKAGCSSIKTKILSLTNPDMAASVDVDVHQYPWKTAGKRRDIPGGFTAFTLVRNPFARLVSAYKNKFVEFDRTQGFMYDNYLFNILHPDMTFAEFTDVVAKVPDRLADGHFKSQYAICFDPICFKKGVMAADHIWKLEDLDARSDEIYRKTGLKDFPRSNQSSDQNWEDYYCRESFENIRARYRNDIDKFDYVAEENALEQLLTRKDTAQRRAENRLDQ